MSDRGETVETIQQYAGDPPSYDQATTVVDTDTYRKMYCCFKKIRYTTASYIVSVVEVIILTVGFCCAVSGIVELERLADELSEVVPNYRHTFNFKTLWVINVVVISVCVALVATVVFLVLGIRKCRPYFLLPHLIVQCVLSFFWLGSTILMIMQKAWIFLPFFLLSLLLQLWFLAIVYRCFRFLQLKQRTYALKGNLEDKEKCAMYEQKLQMYDSSENVVLG